MYRVRVLLVLLVLLAACAGPVPPAGVTLHWSTASEVGVAAFVIERAPLDQRGAAFERVAQVPAAEDVLVGHAYVYVDGTAVSGQAYRYRLVAVHQNGDRAVLGELEARAE